MFIAKDIDGNDVKIEEAEWGSRDERERRTKSQRQMLLGECCAAP